MFRLMRSVSIRSHLRANVYRLDSHPVPSPSLVLDKAMKGGAAKMSLKPCASGENRKKLRKGGINRGTKAKGVSSINSAGTTSFITGTKHAETPRAMAGAEDARGEVSCPTREISAPEKGIQSSEKDRVAVAAETKGSTVTSSRDLNLPENAQEVGECVTPEVLQLRIRFQLVQIVLTSSKPLTLDQVLEVLLDEGKGVLDKTTRRMAVYASHGLQLYEKDALQSSTTQCNDETTHVIQKQEHHLPYTSTEDTAVLRRVGKAFSTLYHTSLLKLLSLNNLPAEAKRSPQPTCRALAFVSHEVLHWITYGILVSDPHFRVSAQSGFVCYPTLPSLLVATWDLSGSPLHLEAKPYLRQRARHSSLSTPVHNCNEPGIYGGQNKPHEEVEKREKFKEAGRNGSTTSHPTPAVDAWETLAYSLTAAIDGVLSEPSESGRRRVSPHSSMLPKTSDEYGTYAKRWEGWVTPQRPALALSKSEAPLEEGNHHHPLVALWLDFLAAHHDTIDSFGSQNHTAALRSSWGYPEVGSSYTTGAPSAARTPRLLGRSSIGKIGATGWNEGQTGSLALRSWLQDATEGTGAIASCMRQIANSNSGAVHVNALRVVNAEVLRDLFLSVFTTAPISVARLATLLRWNVSLPFAQDYGHCFLYFLLLYTANPTLHRLQHMEENRRRRLRKSSASLLWRCRPLDSRTLELETGKKKSVKEKINYETRHFAPERKAAIFRSQQTEAQGAPPTATEPVNPAKVSELTSAKANGGAATKVFDEPIARGRLAFPSARRRNSPPSPCLFQLLLLRRMRPDGGGGGSGKEAEGDNRADPVGRSPNNARGGQGRRPAFQLRHVEVLDTDLLMPREVIGRRLGGQEHGAPPLPESPLQQQRWRQRIDDLSEDILCFPVSTSVLEMRLKPLARRWAQLQEQRHRRSRVSEEPSLDRGVVAITLPLLCRMCLWEHEYGVDMACEMMLLYLGRFPVAEVRVVSASTWRQQRTKLPGPARLSSMRHLDEEIEPPVDVKDLVALFQF